MAYIVVLIQRSGGPGMAGLAVLLAAEGAAGLLSGRVWGRWSDRASQRVMAAAAAISVLVIGTTLVLQWSSSGLLANPIVASLLLFTAAMAHHGVRVGRKTYLLDMSTEDTRASYTAVSNTVMGVVLLSGGALGVLDTFLGTNAVLLLLFFIGLLAVLRCYSLPRTG